MNISNLLQGEKIRLTAVTNEDVTTIAGWYEDTVFSRLFDATPARPRNTDYWLNWLKDQEKKSDNFLFAIRPRNRNELIGYIQLEDFLWSHENCWLSIGIGEKQNWGKGFGREAVELILKYAFHELNLHRFLAITNGRSPCTNLWVLSKRASSESIYKEMGVAMICYYWGYCDASGN